MHATGSGGVNEGLTLWTAGRAGLCSVRRGLTHAGEITHARRVAEIVPLIVHSSPGVSPCRTGAVRLKIQGFILISSFDVTEHPPELHSGFRAVGAQSGQQGTLIIIRWKESSLSHGSQKKWEAFWRIFGLVFHGHTYSMSVRVCESDCHACRCCYRSCPERRGAEILHSLD